jgi:hypothetical protein
MYVLKERNGREGHTHEKYNDFLIVSSLSKPIARSKASKRPSVEVRSPMTFGSCGSGLVTKCRMSSDVTVYGLRAS